MRGEIKQPIENNKSMVNIAILASGSGTNAENITKIFNQGTRLHVAIVITNREKAGVIERMQPLGVPVKYVPNDIWDNEPQQIVDILRAYEIELVVLAGFMHFVSPVIVDAYLGRILNIHPSLLPAYGGRGMWGHHVHEAVVAAGEKKSGVTVHYVTEEMDKGEILMQEEVELEEGETPESLEAKIHPIEYRLYPRAIVKAAERLVPPPVIADAEETAQPVEEETVETVPPQPTKEEEWARVLHLNYDPKAVPPPVPAPAVRPAEVSACPPIPQGYVPAAAEPMPSTHLVWAVLATLLCSLLPGIAAIFMAIQVSARYSRSDIEGARRASRWVEIWIIVSIVLGVISAALYIPLTIFSAAFS